MDLHGVTGKPYSHPKVQRALPAPFQRPSINAGGTVVKRKWQPTKVMDVVADDVVAEFGMVRHVEQWVIRDPHEYYVELTNVHGRTRRFGVHDSVFAFHPE